MDIIFQSGEFFNEPGLLTTFLEPLATMLGVLISALIAIYLFNRGIEKDRELAREQRDKDYEYNRRLENERRKTEIAIKEEERINNLSKFGNLFLELLTNCISTARKQSLAYREYAEAFSKDLLGRHFPKQYPQENLNRLLKLDIQRILDFIELKKATNKDFINTIAQIDYLSTVFTRIPNDIFEGNGKTVIELANKVLQIRNKILKTSSDYLNIQKRDNPEYEKDQLFQILDKMIKEYLTNYDGIPSLSRDYEKLFMVIKDNFLSEPYRYIDLCNELLNLSKEGSDLLFSIKEFNEQQCKDILIALDRINESITKLEEIEKILK